MLLHNAVQNSIKLLTVKNLHMNATSDIPTAHSTKLISPLLMTPAFFAMWNT